MHDVDAEPIEGSHPSLFNKDLAPVPESRRTWNRWHYAALWVGMVVCVPSYAIAAGMIDQGLNWWQACLLVLLGNGIVLIPIILNAHAGTKYGIPFPVFARAAFGVWGANVPAVLRAVVACGWFGIQTWVGGTSLYTLWMVMTGRTPAETIGAGHFLGFGIFWLVNVYFIWKGTESIKFLETWAAPFLIVAGLALLGWGITHTDGLGAMLAATAPKDPKPFWPLFWPNLTAMVGFWATLAINIPDFTRYAKSQREQAVGQALGLPGTMLLFAFIGVAVTGATLLVFGKAIWDPTALAARFESRLVIAIATFALAVATLSTNIAANVVGPANDFANLAPGKLNFRTGGLITAFIGIAMMPWKLLSSAEAYTYTWLIGYSALLGPIGGILIVDYFVLRRMELNAGDLYRSQGRYRYASGFNPIALVALVVGVAPSLPGFLRALARVSEPTLAKTVMDSVYESAWFVGFGLAAVVYLALMKLVRAELREGATPAS
ncbi:MAG: NCS1 family nucleobase:cation symporter-1 [Myxococcota bacterium]